VRPEIDATYGLVAHRFFCGTFSDALSDVHGGYAIHDGETVFTL
jgi:hypothetical protein